LARRCSEEVYTGIEYSVAELTVDKHNYSNDRTVLFELNYTAERLPASQSQKLQGGSCWLGLLGNPVIAKGFPVPARDDSQPGLEVSLETMALLLDAAHVTIFNERAILKGFNAAVVATLYSDSVVLWHFVINKDGSRVTYSDERLMREVPATSSVPLLQLQNARHILGWAPSVSYNFGELSPQESCLDSPGCDAQRFQISAQAHLP